MKCLRQPPFRIPEPIANVWEVVLDPGNWKQVVFIAGGMRTTYSWVVRCCVFKLLERMKDSEFVSTMDLHSVEKVSRAEGHRHLLCLYGADEKRLRLAAIEANCSVSYLVRLALQLYLSQLQKKVSLPRLNRWKTLKKAIGLTVQAKSNTKWRGSSLQAFEVRFTIRV